MDDVIEGGNLAALAGAAAAADVDAMQDEFGPAPGAVEAVGPDPVAETQAVIGVVVGLLVPVLPYLGAIYTEDVQGRLAAAYVPVADKYGWTSGGGIFERYGPELMLAAAALPVVVQTARAHKAWAADRVKKERGEVPKVAERTEGKPAISPTAVQFGTAQPVEGVGA